MDAELFNYLAEFMPDALVDCDGCTRQVEIGKAVQREGKFFHSQECAEISTAVLVKPRAKENTTDPALIGWT